MGYLTINVRLTKRGFLVLLIPYLMASTWYYLFSTQILPHVQKSIGTSWMWANACFDISIALSIFAGSFFVDKVDKLRLIYAWATIMPIATVLLAFTSDLAPILALLLILGMSFGMGLLAYSVYFFSLTTTEERGRVSGVITFIFLLNYSMLLSLVQGFGFIGALSTSVFIGIGTFIIQLLKTGERSGLTTKERLSPIQSYNRRTLLLYMIPWIVFCLINKTSALIITVYWYSQFAETVFQATIFGFLAASFGALIGGVIADWTGRKVALSIGLISYGISTTLSGLIISPRVFIFLGVATGLSWGIFLSVYVLVVWGDIASENAARFYAAGLIPIYFATGIGYLVAPQILQIAVKDVALMSGFLIFLSSLSMVFAPETLPEWVIKEMGLRSYIFKVKEILKKRGS